MSMSPLTEVFKLEPRNPNVVCVLHGVGVYIRHIKRNKNDSKTPIPLLTAGPLTPAGLAGLEL